MFDDVIIGKGDHGSGSVVLCDCGTDGTHWISQNSVSYWTTHLILDIDMIVFKNTTEGEILQSYIKNMLCRPTTVNKKRVRDYLDALALKHISLPNLKRKIEAYGMSRFEEGRQTKLKEIRKAMELDAYNY